MKAFRKNLYRACVLLVLLVLIIGAHGIYKQKRLRSSAEKKTRNTLKIWHGQIASELPSEQQQEWEMISDQHPELLLRNCVNERGGE